METQQYCTIELGHRIRRRSQALQEYLSCSVLRRNELLSFGRAFAFIQRNKDERMRDLIRINENVILQTIHIYAKQLVEISFLVILMTEEDLKVVVVAVLRRYYLQQPEEML